MHGGDTGNGVFVASAGGWRGVKGIPFFVENSTPHTHVLLVEGSGNPLVLRTLANKPLARAIRRVLVASAAGKRDYITPHMSTPTGLLRKYQSAEL